MSDIANYLSPIKKQPKYFSGVNENLSSSEINVLLSLILIFTMF